MKYILDTCIFRKLLDHLPKKGPAFEIIWKQVEIGIENGNLLSVDECYEELLKHYDQKNPNLLWVKERKRAFLYPSNEESIIIGGIFSNPKMQESVHLKNILDNRPSADVYIAAKAKALGATVVTEERYKPHSAQLPNICESIHVPFISYEAFMEQYIK